MPFCPQCKDEFRDGFTTCVDCGQALVTQLPNELPEEKNDEVDLSTYHNTDDLVDDMNDFTDAETDYTADYEEFKDIMSYNEYMKFMEETTADSPALLCTVDGNIKADILESLLKSHNIPVMKKWKNGGDAIMIYMAASSTDLELYVPSRLLERAKLLTTDLMVEETEESDICDDYSESDDVNRVQKRRERARLMLLIFLIPLLVMLITIILMLLRYVIPFLAVMTAIILSWR